MPKRLSKLKGATEKDWNDKYSMKMTHLTFKKLKKTIHQKEDQFFQTICLQSLFTLFKILLPLSSSILKFHICWITKKPNTNALKQPTYISKFVDPPWVWKYQGNFGWFCTKFKKRGPHAYCSLKQCPSKIALLPNDERLNISVAKYSKKPQQN